MRLSNASKGELFISLPIPYSMTRTPLRAVIDAQEDKRLVGFALMAKIANLTYPYSHKRIQESLKSDQKYRPCQLSKIKAC